MTLWSRAELLEATNGRMIGHWEMDGISIDSREIHKGDMFVALKAARDGHEFVKNALDGGASGALVSYVPKGLEDANLLVVDNVEAALEKLGRFRRAQLDAKMIAVTGSAGKTSTKEMLRVALERYGQTHASVKSFNNHWGVPLTLARMPRDAEFGVFEIGMNHPGEIEPLVKQVKPDVAIITNIAPVHLAGFESEEGIAREKASLLMGLGEGGIGIVNGDMIHRDLVAQSTQHELRFFGENPNNDLRLSDVLVRADDTTARLDIRDETRNVSLALPGRHHMMNAAAVLGAIDALGLEIPPAIDALAHWEAPEGRGQSFTISSDHGGFLLVDESYNANPLSMRAAIEAFLAKPAKRHIAILGDMRELGADTAKFHRDLANDHGVEALDLVHAVGQEMRPFYDALQKNRGEYVSQTSEILLLLPQLIQDGDGVLVKASNGVGLGEVVDLLKEMGQ